LRIVSGSGIIDQKRRASNDQRRASRHLSLRALPKTKLHKPVALCFLTKAVICLAPRRVRNHAGAVETQMNGGWRDALRQLGGVLVE
jgi:hypothetical protein